MEGWPKVGRWRNFLCASMLSHLLFLALVRFYEYSSWPGGGLSGWLTYRLALARCGPIGMQLCLVDLGYSVRGAALLASSVTCANLCALYCVFQALRPSRRVARGVPLGTP
jgi:hypothetical protein